ncbi:MAG: hypothetical protein AAFY22_02640 [Pseudomonadota bacterium]
MITRMILFLGAVALTAAIVWAVGADTRGLVVVLAAMIGQPWTLVTLVDLYLGFFIAAVIIMAVERRVLIGAAWALPVFFIGNIWTAIWLIVRLTRIRQAF